jgi:hypothetical protein
MAALLAERPRTAGGSASASASSHRQPVDRAADKTADKVSDSGWLRRLRDRRTDQPDPAGDAPAAEVDGGAPVRLDPHALPPVPPVRPVTGAPLPPAALGGDTIAAGTVAPDSGAYAAPGHRARSANDPAPTRDVWTDGYGDDADLGVLGADERYRTGGYAGPPTGDIDEDGARRHRFVVIGLPLIALVVVVALAVWLGKSVLSVAGNVDEVEGSTPSVGGSSAAANGGSSAPAPAGSAIPVVGADLFDPGGDGEAENPERVELALDGDPATSWSTFTYRGSPAFGNLKDGVGLLLDLGGAREVAGVELTSDTPGANVEIRVGERAGTELDAFTPAADGTIEGTTRFAFDEPATAGFVLVWITGLRPSEGGFAADIAEVKVQAAG